MPLYVIIYGYISSWLIGNFVICPYNYLNGQIGIEIKTYKDNIKHLKVIEDGLDSQYVTLEKKYKVLMDKNV